MGNNYAKLVQNNLHQIYEKRSAEELGRCLPGTAEGKTISFPAFGQPCRISSEGIWLGEEKQEGVIGILLSLYALHAGMEEAVLYPLKAFKDFPGSSPYTGAFVTHTQNILIPHVAKIGKQMPGIMEKLSGEKNRDGDFSFILRPLPKISLCYIFYEADDEFSASVNCLYSNNASLFMPMDGLADVGEYTSAAILRLLS